MLAFFAIVFGIVFLDQLSKWLVVVFLKSEESFVLIKNVLKFTYLENRGAAFGMLDNNRWVFLVVSTVMIVAISFYVIKYRPQNKWAFASCAFIVGGGIGNMIDRVALGYVVDFIDFCAFPQVWYYVFNVADSFVCIGAGILMVYLVFSVIGEAKAEKAAKLAASESEKAAIQDSEEVTAEKRENAKNEEHSENE